MTIRTSLSPPHMLASAASPRDPVAAGRLNQRSRHAGLAPASEPKGRRSGVTDDIPVGKAFGPRRQDQPAKHRSNPLAFGLLNLPPRHVPLRSCPPNSVPAPGRQVDIHPNWQMVRGTPCLARVKNPAPAHRNTALHRDPIQASHRAGSVEAMPRRMDFEVRAQGFQPAAPGPFIEVPCQHHGRIVAPQPRGQLRQLVAPMTAEKS